jgi:hypothetical protein
MSDQMVLTVLTASTAPYHRNFRFQVTSFGSWQLLCYALGPTGVAQVGTFKFIIQQVCKGGILVSFPFLSRVGPGLFGCRMIHDAYDA